MSGPTRGTAGGRAYLDLQNRARREQRLTQELLILYVLERWLARLAISPYATSFILKGGLLLAALDARRSTADADLLAQHLAADERAMATCVREIAQMRLGEDDGVDFLPETLRTQSIRDEALYAGVRLTMGCHVATAEVTLKLDINVGDPVTPAPQPIHLPSQRPGYPAIAVLGYPIETVLAEKACTAIALGEANTRVRDYVDLYTLTGGHPLAFHGMRAALVATAHYRQITLAPLSRVVGALGSIRQATYAAFRTRLGVDGAALPRDFSDVVAAVLPFVDPLVSEQKDDLRWMPATRVWSENSRSNVS